MKTSNYTILRKYVNTFACVRCSGTGEYMNLECHVCNGVGSNISLDFIINSIMYVMYRKRRE